MRGEAIQCDPSYGFRPTCWRPWPAYCRTGPSQGTIQATADPPADWEGSPFQRWSNDIETVVTAAGFERPVFVGNLLTASAIASASGYRSPGRILRKVS